MKIWSVLLTLTAVASRYSVSASTVGTAMPKENKLTMGGVQRGVVDADVSDREVSALINGCYDRRKTYPIDALWESTAWACRYIFGENSVNFDRNSWIGMAGENASHIVTWKITNISGRRIILNYQICMNEMYYIIMSCRQCGGNCVSEGWTQHANEYRSEIFIFVK